MRPLKFSVIGSGWRSLFYCRIAQAYPDLFTLTGLLCRTKDKAERLMKEAGVPAVLSEEDCVKGKPDFIVVAVNKESIFPVTAYWAKKGYPVLCETPAALELDDLKSLWNLSCQGAKIQVAEQYFQYPSYSAAVAVARSGILGDPYAVDISAVHDYHAASIIRRILNVEMENMAVFGRSYTFPVVETDSRNGLILDGRVGNRKRTRLTFEFESGKAAFYDFSSVQYHSTIRSRHSKIQGQRGELDDLTVRYVDEKNRGRESILMNEGSETGISRILLEGNAVYENPFAAARKKVLSQDETAIAALMAGMADYIDHNKEVYPLSEGLQDSYIRILMEQALSTGQYIVSQTQPWG